ncbi:hypothetical protein PQX77_000849 [Marasmius sp. AFHP31]|nr:hypothetical protein PQX77_000849 [Marasmius sp. AFHP31]
MSEDKKKRMKGAVSCMPEWADFNGFQDESLSPPSEPFLVNYVSEFFAERLSDDTARKHMRLLRDHYEMLGMKWQGGTLLRDAVKGCKRLRPPHSVKPERPPVSKERMDVIEERLDLGDDKEDAGDNKDIAIMACIAVAFYGQARMGEILATNSDPTLYNHLIHPTGHDLAIIRDGEAYTLFLPSTKTRIYRGDFLVIPRQSDDLTDPVSAVYRHIVANNLAEGTPLFSHLYVPRVTTK